MNLFVTDNLSCLTCATDYVGKCGALAQVDSLNRWWRGGWWRSIPLAVPFAFELGGYS